MDKSVAADSKNYQDFLRQGQLYGVLAHRLKLAAISDKRDWKADAEMIGMAQKAVNALCRMPVDLNPQADDVWIAMVQLLVDVGQPDKAKPLIGSAEAALKGDQAPMTLAMCCELLNETEKAQAKYEEAAKASPQNSRVLRQVAAFYLRRAKLGSGRTAAAADHRAANAGNAHRCLLGPPQPGRHSEEPRRLRSSLPGHGVDRRKPPQQGRLDRRQAHARCIPHRRPPQGKDRRRHPGHGRPGAGRRRHARRLLSLWPSCT